MKTRVLLVNPPIYDFSAYDFWLKPYGMLRVAGQLRDLVEFRLFDFLDRFDPRVPSGRYRTDPWGRGEYYRESVAQPAVFAPLRRRYRRFGIPRRHFQDFLAGERPFDCAFIQTGMTYWYPGVKEVIDDLRRFSAGANIILGGVYATLCSGHARKLDADLVVDGLDLSGLWKFLSLEPRKVALPLWDLYPNLATGVLKLADGCPFRCTYCSVPQVYPTFRARPLEHALAEVEFLARLGATNLAFYDDALLYQAERILKPFLREVVARGIKVNFHTPNALNARFITSEIALLMIEAGFKNIYLGFESNSYAWQRKTGGKVYADELARAVDHLTSAGADTRLLHAYIIVGHPHDDEQRVADSIKFAHRQGLRVMLSEFSPIPGTPDGESCRPWVDLCEPLLHNKTAFASRRLGESELERLKRLVVECNQSLTVSGTCPGKKIAAGNLFLSSSV